MPLYMKMSENVNETTRPFKFRYISILTNLLRTDNIYIYIYYIYIYIYIILRDSQLNSFIGNGRIYILPLISISYYQ